MKTTSELRTKWIGRNVCGSQDRDRLFGQPVETIADSDEGGCYAFVGGEHVRAHDAAALDRLLHSRTPKGI